MAFVPHSTDYSLSPYTGMTRQSWIEAGMYILQGAFRHIRSADDPMVVFRRETQITYPHCYSEGGFLEAERRAEMFEGLARTFFIAAPLIHEKPELQINGIGLRDYYRSHVLRTCTPGDAVYVGTYEDMQEMTGHSDPFRAFQQTVETCGLVLCLWMCREEIWDTYSKSEKDTIAAFISSFAHAGTVPQNWRMFNMLDMAFLHMEGYPIDEEIMLDHAQAILAYYAGDGWFRDGHSFDYYSCWAFNVYGPVWSAWYGYEHMPHIAKKFEEASHRLMRTYADFFDRDGFVNMWGRSNIYRFAAASAFDGNFFLKHPVMDPGLARRISSGALLQFLSRDDTFDNGVPVLGFYGQFTPLVQGYSCAESPYWMGKAFLCLHLPENHPFWTAKENNGTWERLERGEVKQTVLDGPALCFTNHEANGETILRTGKVVKNTGDEHGMWNYAKLCYNTKYPWEASPCRGIESQQYVLRDDTDGRLMKANVTLWHGERDGVLYRRQFFDYSLADECHWIQAVNLADFPVPYGILRVDRHRLFRRPVTFTLGAYGFPDNGTEIKEKSLGNAKALILKGTDHTGAPRQLAMTVYDGWEELRYVSSTGTNPDSERSVVVYAVSGLKKQYGGHEPYVMISQVVTKEHHEDFTEAELFPIADISYEEGACGGAYGAVTLTMKDGSVRRVDFDGIEGRLMQ